MRFKTASMFFTQLKKLTCITGCVLLLMTRQGYAQNATGTAATEQTIAGNVLDQYGHPLPSVRVQVRGTNAAVFSGPDGTFSVAAMDGSTLLFQHPDFNVQEVKTGSGKQMTVKLQDRFIQTPQSLAVLYDTIRRQRAIGSISSIYSNQLSTMPASLYAYALPGRLAGLYTQQTQGFRTLQTAASTDLDIFVGNRPRIGAAGSGPNDNSEVLLRLRGQNPITIIDGVQRDIYSLDPESIESVSVLKDALSTILLGQRSSRGILLVTTKRPQTGAPRVSFTAETAMQQPLGLPKPLPAYEYAYLLNEALENDGKKTAYTAEDFNAFKNGTNPTAFPDVNWYDQVLRENAPLNRYNFNINGGGNAARYSVSLSYMNQQGFFKKSDTVGFNTNADLKRYIINSNIDVNVTRNFTVGLQLFGRIQEGNQPGATTGTILNALLTTPSNAYPVYNPNGSFGGTTTFNNNLLAQVQNSGYIQGNDKDVMANLDLKYRFDDFLPGLWANAKANISVQSATAIDRGARIPTFTLQVTDAGDSSYVQSGNLAAQSNSFITVSNARYWFAQAALGYDKQAGSHGWSAVLLADQRRTIFNYDLPGTASNLSAKATYNYKEKIFAEAALNYSGYDRYRPGHQFGMFYAGGIGWDLAKENFISNNASWINVLKLRATYGKTGNGVDNSGYFLWRQAFTEANIGSYVQGTSRGQGNGFNENDPLANINITWEKAHKFDVGTDISLFNNRLQLAADYYHDRYYDLLQIRGKSIALIGASYPPENIGINLYQGGELTVTYQNHIRNFNYFISGNGTLEQSKVLFMDEQERSYEWNKRTGLPVGQRFGLVADGFFQTADEIAKGATVSGLAVLPGDIRYKDLNGDGVIDQFDQAPIGTTKPLLYYGLTVGFDYKGIEFSALVQGVQNRSMYVDNSATEAGFQSLGLVYSQAYEQIRGRWTPETAATATYPRLSAGGNTNNSNPLLLGNSFWVHSGDYVRLKNVHLGYTLPYRWTNKIKLSGVKLFVNAQNLLTQAEYEWGDPEVGYGAYPIQRVMNAGINIKL